MKRLLYGVGVVLFVVMVAFWITFIWTGNERWGSTGTVLIVPVFFAFMGASFAEDQKK